jgi:hypothetical protein
MLTLNSKIRSLWRAHTVITTPLARTLHSSDYSPARQWSVQESVNLDDMVGKEFEVSKSECDIFVSKVLGGNGPEHLKHLQDKQRVDLNISQLLHDDRDRFDGVGPNVKNEAWFSHELYLVFNSMGLRPQIQPSRRITTASGLRNVRPDLVFQGKNAMLFLELKSMYALLKYKKSDNLLETSKRDVNKIYCLAEDALNHCAEVYGILFNLQEIIVVKGWIGEDGQYKAQQSKLLTDTNAIIALLRVLGLYGNKVKNDE